jgi:tetrahydromethanopterin S-methyltransferase subunit C
METKERIYEPSAGADCPLIRTMKCYSLSTGVKTVGLWHRGLGILWSVEFLAQENCICRSFLL